MRRGDGAAPSSRSSAAWLAPRNARSSASSSARGRSSRTSPGAPRGRGRPGRGRARPSRARRRLRRRCSAAAVGVLLEPARRRGHSRSSASWATSTWPALMVTSRAVGEHATTSRTSSPSSSARAAPGGARRVAVSLAGQPQQHAARDGLLPGRAGRKRPRRAARPRRARRRCARRRRGAAAAVAVAARARAARSRAAAARPARARRRRRARRRARGSTRRPARSAGALDRAAQLVARIGPTSTWLAPSSRDSSRVGGAAAVEVGPHREDDVRRRASRGSADQRVDERRALGLVAADGERLLELVDREHEPALGRGRERRRELAQRMRARADHGLRPALAAGEHAARRAPAAARPAAARTCRCPTARRSPTAARRQPRHQLGDQPLAPEEVLRVGDWNAASPLNGQTSVPRPRPTRARSRTACSSTTLPASSASIAPQLARPAAALRRPRGAPRSSRPRPLGSRARGRGRGRPPLASSQLRRRTSASSGA